ncbi:MAG TPA: hypothetical protein VNE39_06635 [Planctomycetota bacterium]|nr:hypothetical protein [Planctomycetota bacterium]
MKWACWLLVVALFAGEASTAGERPLATQPLIEKPLALQLDMGTQRVNWNHQKSSTIEFPEPRDWSAFTGLRIKVRTAKPRDDASVTVWLAEDDGSWYHVKDAVPLADAENGAILRFDDFVLAEWVAPAGFHLDEDYWLDLKSIKSLAIGVINPLGVGVVSFTVTAIDLVKEDLPTLPPAKLTVTGWALSVNGHNVVPAGIFGGFAYDLPQEYRPGCQRGLYPTTRPRIPRQTFARFKDKEPVPDWPKVLERLRSGEPLAKSLMSKVDDAQTLARFERLRPPKPDDPKARELPPDLARLLNHLLDKPLYDAEAWKGVAIADALKPKLAAPDKLNHTERMELNRRLLEAAFPELPKNPDAGPTEAFYVDCFGERKETAIYLLRDDWREFLDAWGRAFAANAKASGCLAVLEFWNEPYLNWADRSGIHYRPELYRVEKAVEGGPVAVKRKNPNAPDEIIPHFKWKKTDKGWRVVDDTAFTFWSGMGNGFIYDTMLAVMGKAVKETHPEALVAGGWGFRWNEDHWDAWRLLYKNTIDRNIGWIDAVHEHHYMGEPIGMHGTYEVLAAYGVTAHNKWLYSLNTETNDLLDTPARGRVDEPEKRQRSKECRQMVYNLRDCIYGVMQSPDKLLGRTVIHAYKMPEATRVAYGMMKNLRGRLIEAASTDPDVWVVASVDGTDPKAMPPEPEQTLVVFVVNDSNHPRTIFLDVRPPEGTRFKGGSIEERSTVDWATFAIDLRKEDVRPPEGGATNMHLDLRLDSKLAWKLSLPLEGAIGEKDQVRRRQFFSKDIIQPVRRGKPFATTVALDPEALKRARRAWLRIVVESIARGEGSVAVGGQTIRLPAAYTQDNVTRILDLPLDVAAMKPDNDITFSVAPGNHAGYQVDMASIVLEERERN